MAIKFYLSFAVSAILFLTNVNADFMIYIGSETIPTDNVFSYDTCWFVHGHPDCSDVESAPSGIIRDGSFIEGDLSGDLYGCMCDHPSNNCRNAPHEIERFEFKIDEIGHYTIYPPGWNPNILNWALVSTNNDIIGYCRASREDDFLCVGAPSPGPISGGSIFVCTTHIW